MQYINRSLVIRVPKVGQCPEYQKVAFCSSSQTYTLRVISNNAVYSSDSATAFFFGIQAEFWQGVTTSCPCHVSNSVGSRELPTARRASTVASMSLIHQWTRIPVIQT
ncbi:hypothetical protein DL93DRAFT_1666610 [Clavulina sp. PMI_390]|nr:hypothetical protein DL93DRAFT_1666610 [Clavulina sp. PMI_390]